VSTSVQAVGLQQLPNSLLFLIIDWCAYSSGEPMAALKIVSKQFARLCSHARFDTRIASRFHASAVACLGGASQLRALPIINCPFRLRENIPYQWGAMPPAGPSHQMGVAGAACPYGGMPIYSVTAPDDSVMQIRTRLLASGHWIVRGIDANHIPYLAIKTVQMFGGMEHAATSVFSATRTYWYGSVGSGQKTLGYRCDTLLEGLSSVKCHAQLRTAQARATPGNLSQSSSSEPPIKKPKTETTVVRNNGQ
jgi:hypothetical protein